jgi:hypothetical protein
MEEAVGLFCFLKQLHAVKRKEETHLEAPENVKISDWDHYLSTLQNINKQQTYVLNTLSFQAGSIPVRGVGPLLQKLIRNLYLEMQEENQNLSFIRKLPLSLGRILQNQVGQSFKRKKFFI